MKRIISFSLYGTDPMYRVGALENAALARRNYPGWTPRFYVSQEIPDALVAELRALGAEVVRRQRRAVSDAKFWRQAPANEHDLDAMIVRDADSRLSAREAAAVAEWLASGRGFHIMRDHPYHRRPVMGGMWGCRGGVLPYLPALVFLWKLVHRAPGMRAFSRERGVDQDFLQDMVYPLVRDDMLVHSELVRFDGEEPEPFPAPRTDGAFVGEIIQADGAPNALHRSLLAAAEPVTFRLGPPPRPVRWYLRLRAFGGGRPG